MREETMFTDYSRLPVGRVWWSAIFAGTFVAIAIHILLSTFGITVGAAAVGPEEQVFRGIGLWAGIWSLVTAFVGFFAGGWLGVRLCGTQAKSDGRYHGAVIWAFGTVLLVYLATTSTGIIAAMLGGGNLVQGNIQGTVATVTAASLWAFLATLAGLIGAIAGGHAGGVAGAASVTGIRRAA